MIQIASAIQAFTQSAQEDGTNAGAGLSVLQTFTYFFIAPVGLFLLISVLVYAATGDRKKKAKNDSVITSIE